MKKTKLLLCLFALFAFAACSEKEDPTTLEVDTSKIEVEYGASGDITKTFKVTSNATWSATTDSPTWCTVTASSTEGIIKIKANTTTTSRTAIITVAAKDRTELITVTQEGKPQIIKPDGDGIYRPTEAGGIITITGTTDVAGALQYEILDNTWLHEKPLNQAAVFSKSFVVDRNYNLSERTNKITIKGGTAANSEITIIQAAGSKMIELTDKDEYEATSTQEDLNVPYKTNLAKSSILAESDVDWIHVDNNNVPEGDGLKDAALTILLDKQEEALDRTGTITLSADGVSPVTITIKQTSAPGDITQISKRVVTLTSNAQEFTLKILANGTANASDYTVEKLSSGTWVSQISAPGQGSVKKEVSFYFKAEENTEASTRSTDITIKMADGASTKFSIVQLQPGVSPDIVNLMDFFAALDIEGLDYTAPLPWTIDNNKAKVQITNGYVSYISIGSLSDASLAPRGYISKHLGEFSNLTTFELLDARNLQEDATNGVKATDAAKLTKLTTLSLDMRQATDISWIESLPNFTTVTGTVGTFHLYNTGTTDIALPVTTINKMVNILGINIYGKFTGNFEFISNLTKLQGFAVNPTGTLASSFNCPVIPTAASSHTTLVNITVRNCPNVTNSNSLPNKTTFAKLVVENCPLFTVLPAFDETFTKMTEVSVTGCGITAIPGSYKMLVANFLNLSNNQLSGNLPDLGNIGDTKGYVNVNLSGNKYTGSISNLKFSGTKRTSGSRSTYMIINISNNQLTGTLTSDALNGIFNTTSNNNRLIFSNNQFTGDLTAFDNVVNGSNFKFANNAEFFDLSGNKFSGAVSTKIKNLTNKKLCNQDTPVGEDPLYWADDDTKTAICQ